MTMTQGGGGGSANKSFRSNMRKSYASSSFVGAQDRGSVRAVMGADGKLMNESMGDFNRAGGVFQSQNSFKSSVR